ncbi:hypothetical protein O6H91_Y096700 [Diphasiastrum complanatum]|nr:hypothetical protein O6H91_Y096700 [Diphasiastrum complanatum]
MAAPDNEEPVAPGTPTIQDVVAEVVKSAEGVKDQGDGVVGGNADQVSEAAIAVEPSLPSFKEESYFVADLKESEKKALQDFKVRVESAIREKEFVPPVQQEAPVVAEDKNVEKVESGSAAEPADNGLAEEEKVESPAVTIETQSETAPLADASPIAAEVRNAEAAVQTEAAPAPASTAVESEPEVPRPDTAEALQETPNEDGVPALEDLSLWGIPLLHTKGDERTDVLLLKFLRARDFKVNNAFTMLKNTVLWRQKFGADGLLEEDLGSDLDGFACMCGFDKDGHPVCFNNFGAFQDKELYQKTFGDQTKISHFLRWRVQLLERGIQQLTFSPGGANSMIQVIDLKNSPWPAKKELRVATSQALTLLQDNYPELVVKNILINVPWYFTALYSMISPFLTQRTKSKFVVAGVGKVAETLFK